MESRSISIQEIRIYQALVAHAGQWLTNREIAEEAAVAERTSRAHTAHFVQLGIAEVAELFPAHRYRLKDRAGVTDTSYIDRLEQAVAVLSGIAEVTPVPRKRK
jgi:hypothetical protein